MTQDAIFRLSPEELALAMSMVGNADVAKGLLVSQFGVMDAAQMQERLFAAGHSLIAKSLLSVDTASGQTHLDEALSAAASALCKADFTIRFSRGEKGLSNTLPIIMPRASCCGA